MAAYHAASISGEHGQVLSSLSLTAQQGFSLANSAKENLTVATGRAALAAAPIAQAVASLTPPSTVSQVIKWGGVVAGVVGAATGGAPDVLEALGYETVAGSLGTAATISSGVASASDTAQCIQGDQTACFTAGMGWVAAGLTGFAAVGAAREGQGVLGEYQAFAIGARTSGFFGESVAVTTLVVDAEVTAELRARSDGVARGELGCPHLRLPSRDAGPHPAFCILGQRHRGGPRLSAVGGRNCDGVLGFVRGVQAGKVGRRHRGGRPFVRP